MERWERHVGVYGICCNENHILVINKIQGPYKGRIDLPGGRMETNESISTALKREFVEETGLSINIIENMGTYDFLIPLVSLDATHFHHIALFYKVAIQGTSNVMPEAINEQDASGFFWINMDAVTEHNASPLVLAAKKLLTEKMTFELNKYQEWNIKQ